MLACNYGARASSYRRGVKHFAYRQGVDREILGNHIDPDELKEAGGFADDQEFFCIIGDLGRTKKWKQLSLIPEEAVPHEASKPLCACEDECRCDSQGVFLPSCTKFDLEAFTSVAYTILRRFVTIIKGKLVELYDVVMSHDDAVQLELLPA